MLDKKGGGNEVMWRKVMVVACVWIWRYTDIVWECIIFIFSLFILLNWPYEESVLSDCWGVKRPENIITTSKKTRKGNRKEGEEKVKDENNIE